MKTYPITAQLLNQLLAYILEAERFKDYEMGECREIVDLIDQKALPDIYYQLKDLKS